MPRLSDSMEEGTILRWLKADGDDVQRGDDLVEIETDKATMTYEADQDGVLKILVDEGATLPIGEVIAHIGDGGGPNGGDPAAAAAPAEPPPTEGQGPGTPPTAPTPPAPAPEPGERVKASPIARRIARDHGVDLGVLSGSGPGGRIVKADVEAAATPDPGRTGPPAEPRPPAPPAP